MSVWRKRGPWNYSSRPTLRSDGSPTGSAGKRWQTSSTADLASAIWRQTVGGLIEPGVAGGAAKKGTLRGLVQRNCSAIFTPQEKISLGMIIFWGKCVARLFGRQPWKGSLREATYEAKQAVNIDAEAQRKVPIVHGPEV